MDFLYKLFNLFVFRCSLSIDFSDVCEILSCRPVVDVLLTINHLELNTFIWAR